MKTTTIRSVCLLGMLLWASYMQAQHVVRGAITDEFGDPLPGVNVVVDGTAVGASSDFDGNYNLSVPQSEVSGTVFVVSFSFIGYITESQSITFEDGGQTLLNFQLKPDSQVLEDVVVIGYGTVKKDDATGSVLAVSSDDFNKGAIVSPQEALQGKTPGVQITTAGGAPGAGSTIRIRGGSSLNASNDPLIVIDGIPTAGAPGMRNPLSTINPADIESFTVLKDASATAIYGSRASNGVIIITTKKGKAGAPLRFNYAGNIQFAFQTDQINSFGADDYRALITDFFGPNTVPTSLLGNSDTDWQDAIYRNTVSTDHNFSVSGAAKNMPWRASVGYSNQEGILNGDRMERYTAAINLSPSFLKDHLRVNMNVKGVAINNFFAATGAIGAASAYDPTQPITDPFYDAPEEGRNFGGYHTWLDSEGKRITIGPRNPVAELNQSRDDNTALRSLGNIQLDYKVHGLEDLSFNLNLAYDYTETNGEQETARNAGWTQNTETFDGKTGPASGFFKDYQNIARNQLLDFTVTYAREIRGHKFDVMAGYSWQNFWESGFDDERKFFDDDDSEIVLLDGAGDGYYANENQLVSFFGRANYTYDNRYLFTVTVRGDGSSRFADENRWGVFPSVAGSWKLSEEAFLENSEVVNNLKLRLGWGITGQQDIGEDYPYLPRYTLSDERARYQFGNTFYRTVRPEGYDVNIKWEETSTINAGIDFGFWNDKLNGSFDYYYRETTDLLNFIPVPAGSNLTNQITTNVGDLTNQGVEIAVNVRPVVTDNLFVEIGLNATYNQNEITKLTTSDDPNFKGVPVGGIAGGTGNNIQRHIVGQPAFTYFVFEQVYDEMGKPIEGLYVDRNQDGTINEDDRYYYENPAPDWFLGFSARVEWKKWDFALGMRSNLGQYVYNNVNSDRATWNQAFISAGFLNNLTDDILETDFENSQYFSDYYLEDASFLRVDNLSVGYTLDKFKRDSMRLRMALTANNLAVWTKYSGLDPEIQGGIDNEFYPRPLILTFGVNLDF